MSELELRAAPLVVEEALTTPVALDRGVSRRVRRERWKWQLMIGVIGLIIAAGTFGPTIYGGDPLAQDFTATLASPFDRSADGHLYPLGTDSLGRDTLARVLAGLRISLLVGFLSVLLGGVVGSILGLISGYVRGWVAGVIMRLADMQMAVPFIVFAMILSALLGSGLRNTVIALGVTSWVMYARVVRSQVLSLRSRPYVDAARVLGASGPRIVLRHILPNVANTLIVLGTLEVGRIIIAEAALSYIGLGIQPPQPSLGSMVAQSQQHLFTTWWQPTIPGVAIIIVVLVFVILGDMLRDRFDPRRR